MSANLFSGQDGVYFIAEAGVNHNGERDKAFALIDVAAEAGADAVKFQTFKASLLASASAPKAEYQKASGEAEESQLEMLQKLELPYEWHQDLKDYAKSKGLDFASTAFETASAEFLNKLDIPFFKIPSGEITNLPFILEQALFGKSMIISSGMATIGEVEMALATIAFAFTHKRAPKNLDEIMRCRASEGKNALNGRVAVLHCTSLYPTPPEAVNLKAMNTLQQAFGLPVGYSDHTEGVAACVAAVARGACFLEKHFTLDKELPGPDHKASLDPQELKTLITAVRNTEKMLGDGVKLPVAAEWDTRNAARKNLTAAEPIKRGDALTVEKLSSARCGGGLSPANLWDVNGTQSAYDYEAGEALRA